MLDQYSFYCIGCWTEAYWNGPISESMLAELKRGRCHICGKPRFDFLRIPNVPNLTDEEWQEWINRSREEDR
jgi:hypothetical protein